MKRADIKSAIIKIGGLYLEMSFLGAIGHLMVGSGISDLLTCVYAENTIPHLLYGKAISRSIRGHIMALNTLLISSALDIPLPSIKDNSDLDIDNLENLGTIDAKGHSTSNNILKSLDSIFEELLKSKIALTFVNSNAELLILR